MATGWLQVSFGTASRCKSLKGGVLCSAEWAMAILCHRSYQELYLDGPWDLLAG